MFRTHKHKAAMGTIKNIELCGGYSQYVYRYEAFCADCNCYFRAIEELSYIQVEIMKVEKKLEITHSVLGDPRDEITYYGRAKKPKGAKKNVKR